MKKRYSIVFAAVALLLVTLLAPAALAQPRPRTDSPFPDATPVAAGDQLNLAAMALDSLDVPPDFGLFYEVYIPGNQLSNLLVGGLIPQEEIDATGLEWFYESVYTNADGTMRIRSYVEQYQDELGAAQGFDLLENEDLLAPEGSSFADSPGPGVGENPSEITEGNLAPTPGSTEITSVDSTFRIGSLIAGVSIDTLPGTPADRQLAIDLSQVLHDRIEAVLAGQPLPLINPNLPDLTVSLGPEWTGRDEGYLSATEMLGPEVGPEFEPAFISAYFTNETPGELGESAFPLPLVSISIAEFDNEDAPLALLGRLDEFQPEFLEMERVEIESIPGASAAVAFQYANPILSGADIDSVRVVTIVGTSMVTLDIQANATLEGAMEAAIAIATAQAGCLAGGTDCPPIELEDGLLAEPPREPGGEEAVG